MEWIVKQEIYYNQRRKSRAWAFHLPYSHDLRLEKNWVIMTLKPQSIALREKLKMGRPHRKSFLENWHGQATRTNQRSRCCLSSMSKIKRNGIAVMCEYSKNIGEKSDMADKRDRKIVSGKKTYSKSRKNFLNLTHSVQELNENMKKINESS